MLALVTCRDAVDVDTDLSPLLDALPEARAVAWDDPAVEWWSYDAAILRSTWNYPARYPDFIAWLRAVASITRLWNPLGTVEWNTDKRYLRDLAHRGFPVVASRFVEPGESLPDDVDLDADLVIKPTIGGGAQGVRRTHESPVAKAHIAELHAAGSTAIVQPYLPAIDELGETGLVYLGGRFSHAFEKEAILSGAPDWEGDLFVKETIRPRRPSVAERKLGDRLMASVGATAYARVDLVPGPTGPLLLELELTEPSLFLHTDPGAAERAASVFRSLVG